MSYEGPDPSPGDQPLRVIGIDPGPTPGLVLLDYDADGKLINAQVAQTTSGLAGAVLRTVLEPEHVTKTHQDDPVNVLVGIEAFVVGKRASRSKTSGAGATTRDLIATLVAESHPASGETWVARAAGEVKPWATDERLEAAGLLKLCTGMRHARDAARHALFIACHDGGIRDPFSALAEATKAWEVDEHGKRVPAGEPVTEQQPEPHETDGGAMVVTRGPEVAQRPENDARLSEWRAYASACGIKGWETMNRSQIRTALNLPHYAAPVAPVIEAPVVEDPPPLVNNGHTWPCPRFYNQPGSVVCESPETCPGEGAA